MTARKIPSIWVDVSPGSHVIVNSGGKKYQLVGWISSIKSTLVGSQEGLAPPIERFGSDVFPTVDGSEIPNNHRLDV